MNQAKKKVVVLGGGIGGISAAFELSKHTKETHEISLYQMGWRIGGKGASGRNLNPGYGKRIEEHGLHMWSGLYENSFRVMREAYGMLDRIPGKDPLATIDEAFHKHSTIVLMEKHKGEWKRWAIEAPTNDETPGTNNELYLDLWDYVGEALQLIMGRRFIAKTNLGKITTSIFTLLLAPFAFLSMALYKILRFFKAWWIIQNLICFLMTCFMKLFWMEVKNHLDNDEVRRGWIVANTAFANLKGALKSNVIKKGMEYLDDQDYKAWMSKYIVFDRMEDGKSLTLNSPLVQFIYDAQFSYLEGDLSKPNIGAGGSLRTVIRMAFTWKGAILWKMQGGMGDVVFTPFYKALQKQGVTFNFFNMVKEVQLSADGTTVKSIKMVRQAKLIHDNYEPLVDVKGLPCWPSEPIWEQLEEGERLKSEGVNFESYLFEGGEEYTLEVGKDFDEVIFALPVACIPIVGKQLIDNNVRWKMLVDKLKTVRTGALQTWWNKTSEELQEFSIAKNEPLYSCYHPTPLNTMSDMSFLDKYEDWNSQEDKPASQMYFCGPLRDASSNQDSFNQKLGDDLAKKNALNLLENLSSPLLPGSWNGENFEWKNLYTNEQQDASGIDNQYVRANVNPQERFTLTNTGSTKYRIRPGDSGYNNLFLAGDWTDNSFNLANIEATVMSGMLCSKAMIGKPSSTEIVGLGFGCNSFARY